MKIGIIGSGIVGRVLATAFIREGYDVMLGTRNITKPEVQKWKDENPSGDAGDFGITAKFGEIIVLATAGNVIEEVVQHAGADNFSGKIVIDATNPIDTSKPPVNGVLRFFTDMNLSLFERLQAIMPQALLVKAFNSVGNNVFYKPSFDATPAMFICGSNAGAKTAVSEILAKFGWQSVDKGAPEAAGSIEQLCVLWCIPGLLHNDWTHAFRYLQ